MTKFKKIYDKPLRIILYHEYVELGKSAGKMAKESGVSESTMFEWLKQDNIKKSRSQAQIDSKKWPSTPLLIKTYNELRSLRAVAKWLRIDRQSVKKLFERRGIELRDKGRTISFILLKRLGKYMPSLEEMDGLRQKKESWRAIGRKYNVDHITVKKNYEREKQIELTKKDKEFKNKVIKGQIRECPPLLHSLSKLEVCEGLEKIANYLFSISGLGYIKGRLKTNISILYDEVLYKKKIERTKIEELVSYFFTEALYERDLGFYELNTNNSNFDFIAKDILSKMRNRYIAFRAEKMGIRVVNR